MSLLHLWISINNVFLGEMMLEIRRIYIYIYLYMDIKIWRRREKERVLESGRERGKLGFMG